MLDYNTATRDDLALSLSQIAWCIKFVARFGGSRTLVCKRWASGTPGSWASGTTFIDCDLVGQMSHSVGVVTGLGRATNARVAAAADLSTGSARWRIINAAGDYIEGSLGLAGTDFVLTRSPAEGDGIALMATATISAPANLPVTGKAAPFISDSLAIPDTVVIEDWSTGSAVEAGRISFNVRSIKIHEHPLMADAYGDVAVYQSTQSIQCGLIEFGFTMEVVGGHANSTNPGVPLVQIQGYGKPAASQGWSLYPGGSPQHGPVEGGYNLKAHTTYPPPFKVRYLRGTTELGVKQLPDGSAINTPSMQDQFYDPATGTAASPAGTGPYWGNGNAPLIPHWNCGMALVWENGVPAVNPHARKIYNGPKTYRQTSGKVHTTVLGRAPLLDTPAGKADGLNGMDNIYAMQPYGLPKAFAARMTPNDFFLLDPNTTNFAFYSWYQGYMEFAGQMAGHHNFTAPGGPRHPRAAVPTQDAKWFEDFNGLRSEGNVPWALIQNEFSKGHAGISIYYCQNVKTAAGIPKAESLAGEWRHNDGAYYGSHANPYGPEKAVSLKGIGQNNSKYYTTEGGYTSTMEQVLEAKYDASGRHPWGFASHEAHHHGYISPGRSGVWRIAPMYSTMDRFAYDSHWMGCLGNAGPGSVTADMYMVRTMAWRMHKSLWTWMNCTNHDTTYQQAQVEARLVPDLEKFFDLVVKPAHIDNAQTIFSKGLRNLGSPVAPTSTGVRLSIAGGDLGFYLAETIVLWKTTGFWERMYNKSAKCAAVMDDWIRNLDLLSVDWILGTDGVPSNVLCADKGSGYTFTLADVPDSWASWKLTQDATDQQDLIRDASGTIIRDTNEREGLLMRWQWVEDRKWAFHEYPNPNLDAAIAKWRAYDAELQAAIDAAAPENKRGFDWAYARPGMWPSKPAIGYEGYA